MLLVSQLLLWAILLLVLFLLLGILHKQAQLSWRVEQLEIVTPSRLGRSGLRQGAVAPDFVCPTTEGREASPFAVPDRRVLLVFMQIGCGPCERIIPALNSLRGKDLEVVAVNCGAPEAVRKWAESVGAEFPVLIQKDHEISRRYQVFATPFAFLLNEERVVASKGFLTRKRHLDFVLAGDRNAASHRGSAQALPA
jgi:methylamine dehydrogenase accessory protein MauD